MLGGALFVGMSSPEAMFVTSLLCPAICMGACQIQNPHSSKGSMRCQRVRDGLLFPALTLAPLSIVAFVFLHADQRACRADPDPAARRCDYSRQLYRFRHVGNDPDAKTWRLEARDAGCPLRDLAWPLANGSRPDGGTGQLIIVLNGDRWNPVAGAACQDHLVAGYRSPDIRSSSRCRRACPARHCVLTEGVIGCSKERTQSTQHCS